MAANLCDGCKELDFGQIFMSREIPSTGKEIITIGKRPLRIDNLSCHLCRFFHALRPEYLKNYSQHVRLFSHIQPPHGTDSSGIPCRPFLSVLRKHSKVRYDYGVEAEIKQAGLLGYIPDTTSEGSEIQVINTSVNYELIRGQLQHCIDRHPLCKRSEISSLTLPYILLIDCIQGYVVKRTLGDDYTTLSYVWGNQQLDTEDTTAQRFSLEKAPLTIRDAVQVVRNLGKKYLWVDRYCIDQDNASEKELMLQNMDLIYENSSATIVALYGDNDQSGLPGVSSTPRSPQPCFKTENGRLISSRPPISTMISNSKWNTRGWTYQEARLSRCCLLFSKHQVYLVCRQSTWSEAVPLDPASSTLTELLNSSRLDGALFGLDTSWTGNLYSDRLQYTKRTLTYEQDVLYAFRGILRRSSFISIWGVPVMLKHSNLDPNTGFALGQLWIRRPGWTIRPHLRTSSTTLSVRRRDFPTWSWTSLVADIHQETYGPQSKYGRYIDGVDVDFPHNEAKVKFWLHSSGDLISLQDIISTATSLALPEHNQRLLVEGDLIPLRYKSRGTKNKWYHLFGRWRYFQPDLFSDDQEWPGRPSLDDLEAEVEDYVLVLIQWNESQKSSMKRLLLMVLNWVDDNCAERTGLLTEYRDEFPADLIDQMPRIRKKFVLQ